MKKVMKDYVDFNDAKYFNQISDWCTELIFLNKLLEDVINNENLKTLRKAGKENS